MAPRGRRAPRPTPRHVGRSCGRRASAILAPAATRVSASVESTASDLRLARSREGHPPVQSPALAPSAPAAPERRPRPADLSHVPAVTPESTAMAKELKRRGFRFVGPTTAYALMQATGMVDDHVASCWVPATA
jgi:DNA-3-methyladenine glycosylase I